MTTTDRAPIDEVRSDKSKLVALLEGAGAVFDRGFQCKCVFHEDKHASAGLFQTRTGGWEFKCLSPSCGARGDFFNITSRLTGKSNKDVIREVIKPARPIPAPKDDKPGFETGALCGDFLRKKGVEVEALYPYWNEDKSRAICGVIRCKEDGGKTFKQITNTDKGWKFQKPDEPHPLYNLHLIVNTDNVVVVEGEKAAKAVCEMGQCGTTSIMGAGKAKLTDWTPLAGKRVTLWPDNDDAGLAHMEEVRAELEKVTPRPEVFILDDFEKLELPTKGDAADFYATAKRELKDEKLIARTMADILSEARSLARTGLFGQYASDCLSGKFRSEKFPFPILTNLTKALRPGRVVILCGGPGAGKSMVLIQWMNFWQENGIQNSAFFGEEEKTDYVNRAVAQHTKRSIVLDDDWVRTHPRESLTIDEQTRAFQIAFEDRIWVGEKKKMPDFAKILEWLEKRGKGGDRIIALDPITAFGVGANPQKDLGFLMDAKDIAREYKFTLVMVTHPKQDRKIGESMAAMAGGTAFERFSHTILWLGKLDKDVKTKVRNFESTSEVNINRRITILKVREAKGDEEWIGYHFEPDTVQFVEQGVIIKKDAMARGGSAARKF